MNQVAFNRVKQYYEILHFFPYGNALPILECLSLVFKDRCFQNKNRHLHPMTYYNPGRCLLLQSQGPPFTHIESYCETQERRNPQRTHTGPTGLARIR